MRIKITAALNDGLAEAPAREADGDLWELLDAIGEELDGLDEGAGITVKVLAA